jgi:hypothetical protein
MINEYAVEPEALNNWQNFRYVDDQVGVEHGRLISRFPGKWARMVMAACCENTQLRDVERSRIAIKLKNLEKSKMAKLNRPYDPEKNWMNNIEEQQRQRPFHAVIARNNEAKIPNILNIDELDASHPLWNVPKEQVISRKANELACCAKLLLQVSKEILIIDPHFDPMKSRFRKTFSNLIEFAFEEHLPLRIELHVEYDDLKEQKRATEWKDDCLRKFPQIIPEGLILQVFRWKIKASGDKPHARYVLTERGGIRYDYGLDEWVGEGQTTDVALLSTSLYEQRWQDYQIKTAAFDLVDKIKVFGGRKLLER